MARLLKALTAFVAMAALLVAGPIGSGGVAAAAEGGGKESRLQREVDLLPAEKRAELETRLAEGIAAAGTDLHDPATVERLAQKLGVSTAEIDRAVESVDLGATGNPGGGIVLLFIAIALTFAPGVFQSIAGTSSNGSPKPAASKVSNPSEALRLTRCAWAVPSGPRTSHTRAPSVCFRALKRGPKSRCTSFPPYRGVNACSDELTVVQHARRRGLPTLSVTRCESRHVLVGLLTPRPPRVAWPARILSLPANPRPFPGRQASPGPSPSLTGRKPLYISGFRPVDIVRGSASGC